MADQMTPWPRSEKLCQQVAVVPASVVVAVLVAVRVAVRVANPGPTKVKVVEEEPKAYRTRWVW